MNSAILQSLLLTGLLMQAVFGAAGPTAALCVKFPWQAVANDDGASGEAVVSDCETRQGCCRASQTQRNGTPYRSPIDIAPSCDTGCLHCIDVDLPEETIGLSPRAADTDDMEAIAIHVALPQELPWANHAGVGLPYSTGPPVLIGCPHRDVVRTVRLLI